MPPKEELEEKQQDRRLETEGRWLSGELERGRKGISENLREGSDSTGKLASPRAITAKLWLYCRSRENGRNIHRL